MDKYLKVIHGNLLGTSCLVKLKREIQYNFMICRPSGRAVYPNFPVCSLTVPHSVDPYGDLIEQEFCLQISLQWHFSKS